MSKSTGVRGRVSSLTASLMGGEDTEHVHRQQRGSGARSGPAQMMDFSASFQEVTEEKERLKNQIGHPIVVQIEGLVPSPFQTGGLEEPRVLALVENLRNNPLNSPVVVRQVGDVLEIMSGHHRVEAFKRLGRDTIDAVFSKADDDVARALVFFDNLVSPNLSDLAKYEGFQMLRGESAMTYAEMAEKAGVTEGLVKGLMHFGKLPEAAVALIRSAPHAVGYNAARQMTPFVETEPEKVLACIRALIEGKVTTSGVRQFLEAKKVPAKERTRAEPVTIRQGQKKYADVLMREGEVKIRFRDAAHAKEMQPAILDLLKTAAKK